MRNLWKVAMREFNEIVRTKSFLISIFITPVILALMLVIQIFLAQNKDTRVRPFYVIDQTVDQGFIKGLETFMSRPEVSEVDRQRFQLVQQKYAQVPAESLRQVLNQDILSEKLFAYFVIPADIVENNSSLEYHAQNVNFTDLKNLVEQALQNQVHQLRLQIRQVDVADITWIQRRFDTQIIQVEAAGKAGTALTEAEKFYNKMSPIAFVYLMFIAVMMIAGTLLSSTIEEKNNRVIEVIVSTVTPFQFMTGKIIGIAMSNMIILAVWLGSGIYALVYFGLFFLINPLHFLLFSIYFLLGFLLISSLIAGIGSVCNTLKESQNLMSPIFIFLTIPLMMMMYVGQNPDTTLVVILSYFPFFTPFLMINRLTTSAPPGMIEVILSIILLFVSNYYMMRAAGKIFRVGILMYGKPPSLKDIWRMILEK